MQQAPSDQVILGDDLFPSQCGSHTPTPLQSLCIIGGFW